MRKKARRLYILGQPSGKLIIDKKENAPEIGVKIAKAWQKLSYRVNLRKLSIRENNRFLHLSRFYTNKALSKTIRVVSGNRKTLFHYKAHAHVERKQCAPWLCHMSSISLESFGKEFNSMRNDRWKSFSVIIATNFEYFILFLAISCKNRNMYVQTFIQANRFYT